ncbi:hypothetical protein N0V86_005366, partial [Didymella sp. IMI 355093]
MSLKHLLNEEDAESYPVYAPQLRWGETDDSGFFDELSLAFFVVSPDGTVLGEMNLQLEEALNSIFDQQYSLEFEVYAPIRAIRETISKATKEKDAIARVQINVYGTRAASGAVGRELSSRKIYLQQPECIRSDTIYDNPHFLKLGEHEAAEDIQSSAIVESLSEENTRQAVKETITGVYSALTRGQHLQALEGDRRLCTSLLSHQKQALDFMDQRENGPISSDYLLWKPEELEGQIRYRHTITGVLSTLQQSETGGGILADEMGMGKTLSVLALVLRTRDSAHSWATTVEPATTEDYDTRDRSRSRATLVVASSDLMINEWLQELERPFSGTAWYLMKDVWTTKSSGFAPRNFKRIDGDCPTSKRERILEDFAHDDNLRVLIMTTGTGAVGLNLAVANRVFIVEPQWNPSVENQAIARALRLGQRCAVLVTRYVVESSVEQ